jgi:ACT domain-containing protein
MTKLPNLKSAEAKTRAIVTVIGEDQVGIIAGVAVILADSGANILDISQSIMQEFFVMTMMVDLAGAKVSFDELKAALNAKGASMSLKIDIQREDVFKLMHRV